MSNQSLGKRVHSELRQAVQSGLLPATAQEKATKLLTRLDQPVRLALMGMPGSGKSTLMNLLVGADVMVEGVRLPTLQLSYGEKNQAICTLPDGSKQILDTVDAATIAALSPLFVDLKMPLPALAKISVLEVVAPNDPTAIQRATQWASKRCDIALWCTRGFVETEQEIWAPMPDLIKDHAFCMMTRADLLEADGLLDAALGAVQSKANEEFNLVLPIGTVQAIAARRPDGSVDKDMLRASGGLALISAVLKQVDQGKQSAIDMADILLHENAQFLAGATADPVPAPEPEPVIAPEPAPKPEAVVETDAPPAAEEPETPAPKAEVPPAKTLDAIARLRQIAAEKSRAQAEAPKEAESEPEPSTVEEDEEAVDALFQMPPPDELEDAIADTATSDVSAVEPADAPAAVLASAEIKTLEPATREAYQHVVDYIADKSQTLAEQLTSMGDEGPTEVMDRAVEHIQWLCDYLNDNGDETDPSLMRVRDTAFDAADLVQLMQMEKRDSAALEAVSLMLQIKRELQADLAA